MRISGGNARGIELRVPKGDATRPATDGMRQSLFSSLGARVVGSHFLDLFAGSGGYGLEALSRGAKSGVFVEKSPKAIKCLEQNIEAVCKSLKRSPEEVEIFESDALSVPVGDTLPDLVFIDPPYDLISEVAPKLFQRLSETLTDPDALILFEMPGEIDLQPPGWKLVKRLGKGAHQPTVACFRRGLF